MPSNKYIGEVYRFTVFVRASGVLTTPDAITCTAIVNGITKVDAVAMTLDVTGTYYHEITLDVAGNWDISSQVTSGNLIEIEHDQIVVNPAVAYALCSLQELKDYLGISRTTTTYDTTLMGHIDGTTGLIEDYCHRKFANQAYALDRYNGDSGNYLMLDNYPVTSLTRLSIGTRCGMYVKNTSSDSGSSYVSVDANNITLTVVGGTNDGTTTVSKTTYATLTAIVDQINDTGSGWAATIQSTGFNNIPSTDLLDQFGLYTKDANAFLYIPEVRETEFNVDTTRGIIHTGYRLCEGHQNIVVDYTAGFTTIPEGLKAAAMALASYMYYGATSDPTVKSEKLGDYAYTTGADPIGSNGSINSKSLLGQKLNLYRRHIIV